MTYLCPGTGSLCFRSLVKEHPLEVMKYAARHDYPAIVEEIAPFMLDRSLVEMCDVLSQKYFVAWVRIPSVSCKYPPFLMRRE